MKKIGLMFIISVLMLFMLGEAGADDQFDVFHSTDWAGGVLGFNLNSMVEGYPHDRAKYGNLIDWHSYILTNNCVNQLHFYYPSYDIEPPPGGSFYYDYFQLGYSPNSLPVIPNNTYVKLAGHNDTANWISIPTTSGQKYPIPLSFYSDISMGFGGINLEYLIANFDQTSGQEFCYNIPCCKLEAKYNTQHVLEPTRRYIGWLFGNHDVVYIKDYRRDAEEGYWKNGPNGDPLYVQSRQLNYTLFRDGEKDNTFDFDIYIKCNAFPTPTSYDYRPYLESAFEYIETPNDYCTDGTIYIAINSCGPFGKFYFMRSDIGFKNDLTAGITWNATSAEIEKIRVGLSKGSRIFFGMTEGQAIVEDIFVTNNTSDCQCNGEHCNICIYQSTDSSTCHHEDYFFWTDKWIIMRNWNSIDEHNGEDYARIFSHELGHCLLGLKDEYNTQSGNNEHYCGHSMMDNNWPTEGNIGQNNNICNLRNHYASLDRIPINAPIPASPHPQCCLTNSWQRYKNIEQSFPYYPYVVYPYNSGETPDNFSYDKHPFNYIIGDSYN